MWSPTFKTKGDPSEILCKSILVVLGSRLTCYMHLDVCIIELGGTVGDIESAAFIESMRQLRMKAGNKENFVSGPTYSLAASTEFIKVAHTCHIYPSDPR